MDFLPIFLNVRNRLAVIVGGGAVAARKADLLLQAGASVRVVAPALASELAVLRDSGRIEYRAELFAPAVLDGAVVVIAATNQPAV